MKRKELLARLAKNKCILVRNGAKHDIYLNPINGCKQPVPRHAEIDEHLARHIMKYLGISDDDVKD